MNNEKENTEKSTEGNVQFEDKIDREALDVIMRLYDKTFKELVDR